MIKKILGALILCSSTLISHTTVARPISEDEKVNFMLVVRTSFGSNKNDGKLIPTGKQTIQDSKGKSHTFNMAHFEFVGDTHIRFVFDSEFTMDNVSADEFDALGLSPNEAVTFAMANIHRSYGKPQIYQLGDEYLFKVQGTSPDLNSSYFLDRQFWLNIEKQFNEKIIVAVPSRDTLLFTLDSKINAKKALSEHINELYLESGQQKVSSALFSFHKGKWAIYQPPSDL